MCLRIDGFVNSHEECGLKLIHFENQEAAQRLGLSVLIRDARDQSLASPEYQWRMLLQRRIVGVAEYTSK